jgi:hypothetical protein
MLSINSKKEGKKDTTMPLPEIKIDLFEDSLGLGPEFDAAERDIDWYFY